MKAQTREAIAEMRHAMPVAAPPTHIRSRRAATVPTPTNEIQALSTGLFFVYKRLVSSQDRPGCTFYPSCSEYALRSIRKRGIVIGALATLDRLTRCNGGNAAWYTQDQPSGKLSDLP